MNEVTSRPRTLQPYVMEITEVKKKHLKKKFLFARKFSEKLLISLSKIDTSNNFKSESIM